MDTTPKKTTSGIQLPPEGVLIPTLTQVTSDALPINTVFNADFRSVDFSAWKDVFVISDPPYNQNYRYSTYTDNLEANEYTRLLQDAFGNMKSVIIHYPEPTINLLPAVTFTTCTESVSWVYNSNTAKQSRLISWWNCKPNFMRVGQPYKNPNDKRIQERIAAGKQARLYDWWDIPQVKNVSKNKSGNPHPCPIPEEIARRIILTTTESGDLVVDPFAGSGTILKVAKELGRMYLGFEIDNVYFKYMKAIGL